MPCPPHSAAAHRAAVSAPAPVPTPMHLLQSRPRPLGDTAVEAVAVGCGGGGAAIGKEAINCAKRRRGREGMKRGRD